MTTYSHYYTPPRKSIAIDITKLLVAEAEGGAKEIHQMKKNRVKLQLLRLRETCRNPSNECGKGKARALPRPQLAIQDAMRGPNKEAVPPQMDYSVAPT
ncbi:hypothetical protein Nepgr_014213 [Nepenthes gracilis]|uniref:Uncharacterized protein n=1 Tax=Nepenthes gracilis TaxID=150966 RepID=A0AAD3XPB4_NEPGR|nr:hypothetical protein Nepgr_014213 [Nepenthes gracilis]